MLTIHLKDGHLNFIINNNDCSFVKRAEPFNIITNILMLKGSVFIFLSSDT